MTATLSVASSPGPVRIELVAGVAHLVLDAPGRSANVMDDAYGAAMEGAVRQLAAVVEDRRNEVRGVLIRSAKRTFFAGGDLDAMIARPRTHVAWRWRLEQVQRPLRMLEALPVPVVAAINGAAVGGGLEVALAADARVALDGTYPIGLPEVTLGVLAAGGGISRSVRLLGLRTGLEDLLLPGATVTPREAHDLGLVDQVVEAGLIDSAILALDRLPRRPSVRRQRPADRGWLRALWAQVEHGVADAPRALLDAAVAGVGRPLEQAQQREVEAFLRLVTGPQFGVTLRAAYGERQRVLRSIERLTAVGPAPDEPQFTIAAKDGAVFGATRFGVDLRRGVVEIVVPFDTGPDAVEHARRLVRGWGGCPVVSRGGSFVASLSDALSAEAHQALREGVSPEVLRAAFGRLGVHPAQAETCGWEPLLVGDVADRLACAVSLAALRAVAPGAGQSRPAPGVAAVASVAEANLASVAGVGFPEALGGALGHILHHVTDDGVVGVAGFARTAEQLARRHGDRLRLTPELRARADRLSHQEDS